jgi:hypothetical protein
MPKKIKIPSCRAIKGVLNRLAFDPRSEAADAIFRNPDIYNADYLVRNAYGRLATLVKGQGHDKGAIDDIIRLLIIAILHEESNGTVHTQKEEGSGS